MKIAFVVGQFPKISETFILDQITGIVKRGHDVTILAETDPGEKCIHDDMFRYSLRGRTVYTSDIIPPAIPKRLVKGMYLFMSNIFRHPLQILESVNVFRYGSSAVKLRLLFYVVFFLKNGFDVLYAHFGPNGRRFLFLKDILNIKLVTVFHGYDLTQYVHKNGKTVYDELFRKGDLFLPISDLWRDRLCDLGVDATKIIVHRMGIDIPAMPFREKAPDGTFFKMVSVCRLVEKKGLRYSIRAVAALVNRYPRLRYYIIGDGPLRNQLERLISEQNARNHIFILGSLPRETVKKVLYTCHAFVLASVTDGEGNMEGIPVSLMEAMAIGLPVISTFHSAIPELVLDGRTGFLVPERDVPALIGKIRTLLENPDAPGSILKNARETVEKNHDSDRLNDTLIDILSGIFPEKNLCESNRAARIPADDYHAGSNALTTDM